jgi:hypothetical protein
MKRAAALALLVAACSADATVRVVPPQAVLVTQGPSATGDGVTPQERWPDGCRVVVADDAASPVPRIVLSEGLAAAGGPAVRFDGARVAFVACASAGEAFGVWTCGPDGSGRARVAGGVADCGSVAFLGDGRLVWSQAVSASESALFVGDEKGAAPQRITFSGGVDVDPSPLPDGRIVFASRGRGGAEFVLLSVHVDGTGVTAYRGKNRSRVLASRDERVTLEASRKPQGHLSVVDPAKPHGDVFCVDARPAGASRVRSVRLAVAGEVANPLGEAPVEDDGSFFARVPADVPLVLDVVDEAGRVVAAQHTPFWVRPGETRGCIGCHEDPDTAPPNVRPVAVRGAPARLAPPPATEGGR